MTTPTTEPSEFEVAPGTTRLVNGIEVVPVGARAAVPVEGNYYSIPRLVGRPDRFVGRRVNNPAGGPAATPAPVRVGNIEVVSDFILPMAGVPVSVTA